VLVCPTSGMQVVVRTPNKQTPAAVCIAINGGALQSDAPIPGQVDADLVTSLGFVMVELFYDIATMARAYQTALASYQWVLTQLERWGGDLARVHGVGHSSGASLISLLGLRDDSPGFTGAMF